MIYVITLTEGPWAQNCPTATPNRHHDESSKKKSSSPVNLTYILVNSLSADKLQDLSEIY